MSITILLIDDEPQSTKLYARYLKSIKTKDDEIIQIKRIHTVNAALEFISLEVFEILVVDLKIPSPSGEVLGGLELIDKSLDLNPLRPIVAVTAFGTKDIVQKLINRRVYGYVEKGPEAGDKLTEIVQEFISKSYDNEIRVGNPFFPRTGREPRIFGGRTEELEFFEEKLNRGLHDDYCEHFLVLGSWGIGKSTLLKEYKKICQSRGFMASIVQLEALQKNVRTIEAAHSLIEGVLNDLPLTLDRFKRVFGFFDSIGFNILGSGVEVTKSQKSEEVSAQAYLRNSLINIWQDISDKTKILVILIDDLENFILVPEIIMNLKSTLSMNDFNEAKILVGIACTIDDWLELTSIRKHHPLARFFLSRVELNKLTYAEVSDTINASLKGTGVSFSVEIIEKIMKLTQGHPFEMQLICYHLYKNKLSNHVTIEVWDKALQAALKDIGNANFEHIYSSASEQEEKVLALIAQQDCPVSAKTVEELAISNNYEVSLKSISGCLRRLARKKLLIKSRRGVYDIPDEMLRTYIRTNYNDL